MDIIFYILGLVLTAATGYLAVRFLCGKTLNPILHILLGLGLGLGIDGTVTFYTRVLLNQSNRFIPIVLVILLVAYLSFPLKSRRGGAKRESTFKFTQAQIWGLVALAVLAIPLAVSGHYFPLGGWDAWSCWSLKAKFLFTAQDNWKDMFLPDLWRSNTHYPLLWPLINVWFADMAGRFDQTVLGLNFPMFNSLLIALLTAGLLLFGLLELTGLLWVAIAASVVIMALPFDVTLFTSQYSDSLLGLYLMSAFLCLLLAEKCKLPKLKILSMIFLGLMAFTKNEGLAAAAVTALLIFWQERRHKKGLKVLMLAFFAALLPTIIFMAFIAPKNEAFINGLTSTDKPTNWSRLVVIAVYPWMEFISAKWNGFWFLVLGGIILGGKKLWQSTLGLMGLSVALYLGVVMAYYAVNTFFEIGWWLSTTLSRILFALLPTIALWVCLGVKPTSRAA